MSIRAFLSYAREDARADPLYFDSITNDLEERVNVKLTSKERFTIWRDKDDLRTGDRWNDRIESALRESDVFIIILTPKWIISDYCLKEYSIFEQIEAARSEGDYTPDLVAPISGRPILEQDLQDDQREIYARICRRQLFDAPITDYSKLNRAARIRQLDELADDLVGMILRRRSLASDKAARPSPFRSTGAPLGRKEFNSSAQNYEKVDFVKEVELIFSRTSNRESSLVLGQADFVERLFVQSGTARIEFGVRRAFIMLRNSGKGLLSKIDALRNGLDAYYVTRHEDPEAICICMNPPIGKRSLAELSLPPAADENRLSEIAVMSPDVKPEDMGAELIVSLDVEGLYLSGDHEPLSKRTKTKIEAIMLAATAKVIRARDGASIKNGELRRPLSIRDRHAHTR
jgi:TIR domain